MVEGCEGSMALRGHASPRGYGVSHVWMTDEELFMLPLVIFVWVNLLDSHNTLYVSPIGFPSLLPQTPDLLLILFKNCVN